MVLKIKWRLFFQSKEEDTGANHSLKTLSPRRGLCLLGHLEFWIIWAVIRMHLSPTLSPPAPLPVKQALWPLVTFQGGWLRGEEVYLKCSLSPEKWKCSEGSILLFPHSQMKMELTSRCPTEMPGKNVTRVATPFLKGDVGQGKGWERDSSLFCESTDTLRINQKQWRKDHRISPDLCLGISRAIICRGSGIFKISMDLQRRAKKSRSKWMLGKKKGKKKRFSTRKRGNKWPHHQQWTPTTQGWVRPSSQPGTVLRRGRTHPLHSRCFLLSFSPRQEPALPLGGPVALRSFRLH